LNISAPLQQFKIVFSIPLPGSFHLLGQEIHSIDITETILISWVVMAVLIGAALLLSRRLQEVPRGAQVFLEAVVEFSNTFFRGQFGKRAPTYGPYLSSLFLFLLLANIIPAITPVAISCLGVEPPFTIKPPARDINFTAALAILSILLVLLGGIRARGPRGWLKNLCSPMPLMLPFNLLDYISRPLSLCLRLFGNVLGSYIIMLLIEQALPVPLIVPAAFSLYFDFFDGFIQALVFVFLTTLYTAEAVVTEG